MLSIIHRRNMKRPYEILGTRIVQDCSRYGTIGVSEDGEIEAFREKTPIENGWISGGVYLMRKDVLLGTPPMFSLEADWLEPLAPSGALGAVGARGAFIDIGTPEDYEQARKTLPNRSKRPKLAFFDHDGTVNVDTGHLFQPEDRKLIPETVSLIRSYNQHDDCRVVVVINQAGIAKRLYNELQMRRLHEALDGLLAAEGAYVDAPITFVPIIRIIRGRAIAVSRQTASCKRPYVNSGRLPLNA